MLGQLVRQTREEAGMDIERLARLSDLSADEIQTIEQGGDPEPSYSDFIMLAGALGVTPGDLLGIVRYEPSYTPGVAGGYVWTKDVPMKLQPVPRQCPRR